MLLEAGELTLIRRDEPYRISFDEPNRTHAVLGRALGVSARWVQLAFARRGTTLGAHLLEQRLQRAARRLAGPDGVPVGRLALELGFNELSHFCRSFRRRFGCSARDWRAGRTPR